MRIFHVRGCIIEISALGRIKSGRRDQWLTRIVGAVRKIPYLHTKIRARPLARWASVLHSFFSSLHSFSPLSDQSARATFSLLLPPLLFVISHPAERATHLNQIVKLDAPSNPRIISCATSHAVAPAVFVDANAIHEGLAKPEVRRGLKIFLDWRPLYTGYVENRAFH